MNLAHTKNESFVVQKFKLIKCGTFNKKAPLKKVYTTSLTSVRQKEGLKTFCSLVFFTI